MYFSMYVRMDVCTYARMCMHVYICAYIDDKVSACTVIILLKHFASVACIYEINSHTLKHENNSTIVVRRPAISLYVGQNPG